MSKDDHVTAFISMEQYLRNRLGGIDTQQLNNLIMDWAEKDPIRWQQWEELVRRGQRLQELQLFAKSLENVPDTPMQEQAGGIFDL